MCQIFFITCLFGEMFCDSEDLPSSVDNRISFVWVCLRPKFTAQITLLTLGYQLLYFTSQHVTCFSETWTPQESNQTRWITSPFNKLHTRTNHRFPSDCNTTWSWDGNDVENCHLQMRNSFLFISIFDIL